MNDNTKLNTFLSAIIVSLCVVIGVLTYFVFSDDFGQAQLDVRTRASVVAPVVEEVQAKPKPKKKVQVDDSKPIYVMGEDGEAARRGQIVNSIMVSRSNSQDSLSNNQMSQKDSKAYDTHIKANDISLSDETPVIGNRSSLVYHYPHCSGVAAMNPKNEVHMTAGDAKAKGYRLHQGCPD